MCAFARQVWQVAVFVACHAPAEMLHSLASPGSSQPNTPYVLLCPPSEQPPWPATPPHPHPHFFLTPTSSSPLLPGPLLLQSGSGEPVWGCMILSAPCSCSGHQYLGCGISVHCLPVLRGRGRGETGRSTFHNQSTGVTFGNSQGNTHPTHTHTHLHHQRCSLCSVLNLPHPPPLLKYAE